MNDELEAIKQMLPEGIKTYIVAAFPESLPPYYVIALIAPAERPDEPVRAKDVPAQPWSADVRLTAVSGTPGGALDLLTRARAILAPNGGPSFPAVESRSVQLDFRQFEVADVDTSVKIPQTNRNPAFAVDSYALSSEPS